MEWLKGPDMRIILANHASLTVGTNQVHVPTLNIADHPTMFRKCKLLYDKVAHINRYTSSTLQQIDFVETSSLPLPPSDNPDSDDEQIADVGSMPMYTSQEGHTVVHVLKKQKSDCFPIHQHIQISLVQLVELLL